MKRRTLCSIRLVFPLAAALLVSTAANAADLQYQVFNQSQLADAIIAANKVAAGDTVTITIRNNISLTSELPVLQKEGTTIVGQSTSGLPVTLSGNNTYRGLLIDVDSADATTDVTLQKLNFANCTATGGDGGDGLVGGGGGAGLGGALMVKSGDVVVEDVYFQNNTAAGGDGGTVVNGLAAGGGGGLGGDGGNGGTNNGGPKAWTGGGGGGVGVNATGGDVATTTQYDADGNLINGGDGIYQNLDPSVQAGKAYASEAGVVGEGGSYAGGGAASVGSKDSNSYGNGGGGGVYDASDPDKQNATRTAGGDGGYGGGGGGSMGADGGGDGGYGGGGGGAVLYGATGGDGGFGGGGGGSILTQTGGAGGFGAGDGGATGENDKLGGDGGGGLGGGGAVFVENNTNTSLTVQYSSAPLVNPGTTSLQTGSTATPFSGNTVTGGEAGGGGAEDGQAIGSAVFLGNDMTIKVDDWSGNTAVDMTISQSFGGEAGEANFDPTKAANVEADGGIIKTGTGTLLMTGNNTYTGKTDVQAGELHVDGGNVIGDYSELDIAVGAKAKLLSNETVGWVTGGGDLQLNNQTLDIVGTAEREAAVADIDYSGTITSSNQGDDRINKRGTGTLQLSGDNYGQNFKTYIYDGTVAVGNKNALGDHVVYVRTGDTQYNTIEASATLGANAIVNDFSIGTGSVLKIGGDNNVDIAGRITGSEVIMQMNADGTELRLSNSDATDAAAVAAAEAAATAYTAAAATAATANADAATAAAAAAADPTDAAKATAAATAATDAATADANARIAKEAAIAAAVGPSSIERLTLRKGTFILTQNSKLGGATLNVEGQAGLASDAAYAGNLANTIELKQYGELTVDTTNNIELSGGISGTGSLRHNGGGTLTLTNGNSYTGGTILNGGTLILGDNNAAGTGAIQAIDDSTIETTGDFTGTNRISNNVILADTKTLTLGGTHDYQLAGDISGAGNLNFNTGGTLTLSGNNTHTGLTTITSSTLILDTASGSAGVINLAGANSKMQLAQSSSIGGLGGSGTHTVELNSYNLTINGTTNANFIGAISGTGGLIKKGTNSQMLSGTNTFTGDVTVNEGILILAGGAALNDTVDVTLTGGTLQLDASETIGTFAGTGGTVALDTNNLTVTEDASTSYAGVFTGAGGTLTKNGTGQLTLTGDSSAWTNSNVAIDGGTIRAEHANSLGASMNTLTFGALGGTLSLGAAIAADPTSVVLTGNGTILGDDSSSMTISGVISGAGDLTLGSTTGAAGSIPAAFTLGGNNTYTGATTLAGGNIILESDTAFGASSGVSVTANTILSNDSDVNARAIDRNFALGSGTMLALNDQGGGSTYSGIISGAGGLDVNGIGQVTLTGNNTYTGATSISTGELVVATSSNLGTDGTLTLMDGGQLVINSGSFGTTSQTINIATGGGTIMKDASQASTLFTTTGQITGTGNLTLDLGSAGNIGVFTAQQQNIGSGVGFTIQEYTNLVLNGTGGFTMNNLSGAGDVTMDAADTLTINTTTDTTYSGTLATAGDLVKTGDARWTLDPGGVIDLDKDAGFDVIVAEGELKVNGDLEADQLIIQSGATFSGVPTTLDVNDVIVKSGGTFLAGNSPGTTTITGNATFEGTIKISTTPGSPPVAGTNNSVTNVVETATIVDGAKVYVESEGAGSYVDGDVYTVINAGTLVGDVPSYTSDNIVGFYAETFIDGTSLKFKLNAIDFVSYANTPNQMAMASYMARVADGGLTTSMSTLVNEMETRQVSTDFDQLSGAIYATASTLGLQNTSNMMDKLAQHLRPTMIGGNSMMAATDPSMLARAQCGIGDNCGPTWNTWGAAFGLGGNVYSDGNAVQNGLDYSLGGTLTGIERNLGGMSRFGVYFGYAQSYMSQSVIAGVENKVNTKNCLWGSYLTMDHGASYTTITGAIGYDDYQARRNLRIGSIVDTARGHHDGWQSAVYLEHGLSLGGPRLLFQPYGALQHIYLRQGGFTERNAGEYGLEVGGIDLHSLRTILGGRLARTIDLANCRQVTFEGRGLWMHELLDQDTGVLDAQLIGNPTGVPAFAVSGVNLGRDWAVVGTGVNYKVGPRLTVYGAYDAQLNANQVFHVGSAGAQLTW